MFLSPTGDAVLAGVVGLVVGSFLNVVVHRFPRMLERNWWAETLQHLLPDEQLYRNVFGEPPRAGLAEETARLQQAMQALPPLTLSAPASRCPACGHRIRWWENVPVASWLVLRARCSACAVRISARYPAVELATAALFAFCGWRFGLGWQAALWCFFSAVLLVAALIDWDTTYLPDEFTQALVWAGIIGSAFSVTGLPLAQSALGAVAGYGSLWLVNFLFCLVTRRQRDEGMASGDFKLFAGLGAWFGWPALVPLILMASLIGSAVGLVLKARGGLREGGYIPFGPFLALAGFTGLVFGPQSIMGVLGL